MYVFSVGDRAKVIKPGPQFGKLGTVQAINPQGYTNTIPPQPFGERDTVLLDGETRTRVYDVSELEKVV